MRPPIRLGSWPLRRSAWSAVIAAERSALPQPRRPVQEPAGDPPDRRARGGPDSLDHEATWLLGHTEQIDFLELWEDEGDLYVEAMLHVPCRYLHQDGGRRPLAGPTDSRAGPARRPARQPQPLAARRRPLRGRGGLPERRPGRCPCRPRTAPGARHGGRRERENPCALAPCRTADNTREGGLLPRPADRDHVYQAAAPAGGAGALAPVAVSLQDRAGGRLLHRGRDDLRLRLPRPTTGSAAPCTGGTGRTAGRQAGPLQRVAAEEPGAPPGLRLRPRTPAARPRS